MTKEFGERIQDCWSRHDKESEAVADELSEMRKEISAVGQLASWAPIAFHTIAGHLADLPRIVDLLDTFADDSLIAGHDGAQRLIARLQASAAYAQGEGHEAWLDKAKAGEQYRHSAEVRVYSLSGANLAVAGQIEKAVTAFELACQAMPEQVEDDDPSAKSLAITANNLATDFEELSTRSEAQTEFMLKAANIARKYWGIAGTWLEIERAEYRLSQSYMQAGDFDSALNHAKQCLELCEENDANPFEMFFAHEAQVNIQKAICETYRAKVKKEAQQWLPKL